MLTLERSVLLHIMEIDVDMNADIDVDIDIDDKDTDIDNTDLDKDIYLYGVATISRLLKIIGLVCKMKSLL